jgi:hypothetical protein
MIIFRRAGEAFKRVEDREWLLLALETLGVLIGILVAFELQQWGAQRDQAAKHHELMERLFEESLDDVSALRGLRDALKPIVSREQAFAVTLAKSECPSNDAYQAITTLSMYPAITVPTSVYQELMGAGGLSPIERKDVREKLGQFHGDLDWSEKQVDYFRTVRIDPLSNSDPRQRTHFDPTADEPEVSTFDGPRLCHDEVFKSRVAKATRAHMVYMGYVQGPLQDAINVCLRLGDSLGHQCTPEYGGPLRGDDATYAKKVLTSLKRDKARGA